MIIFLIKFLIKFFFQISTIKKIYQKNFNPSITASIISNLPKDLKNKRLGQVNPTTNFFLRLEIIYIKNKKEILDHQQKLLEEKLFKELKVS